MGIILPEDIKCWGEKEKKAKTTNPQTTEPQNNCWVTYNKTCSYCIGIAFSIQIKKKPHRLKQKSKRYLFQTENIIKLFSCVWGHTLLCIYLQKLHVSLHHRTADLATGCMVQQMLQCKGSPYDWQWCRKPSNSCSWKPFASWKAVNKRGNIIFGQKIVVLW